MIEKSTACFDELKAILKNIRNPEALNDHPWALSLIVQEALAGAPHLKMASPGEQLVSALASLFSSMQPPVPPRRAKRLDPRWGEFGLLAALYFTPFNHGTPYPSSFLEAWSLIDPAILYCVYGKSAEELSEEQIRKYQLVGSDLEFGSVSTLSDWHKKGLQRFVEIILNRERVLNNSFSKPSSILGANGSQTISVEAVRHPRASIVGRSLWLFVTLVLITGAILGGVKARQLYFKGRNVYQDVTSLQVLVREPLGSANLESAGLMLRKLQEDLLVFKSEAQPLLWVTPALGWIPTYGDDLKSAPALIELTEHLVDAANLACNAAKPLFNEFNTENSTLDLAGLTNLLVIAQPQFQEARQELEQALIARENINAEQLSPRLRGLIMEELDPVLGLAEDGLSVITVLPEVLGASTQGPQTYLLLAENEDELRTTGGFITSIGNLVLHDGQVVSLNFEQVEQEDWTKPYPAAPWQLQEYMNSPVLILRDANWFTDFPTTVQWVENLYAYTHAHSVDGVIAFDQHFLVMLLGQLDPLTVDGAPYPITDKNVIEYMRQAKKPPAGEPIPADWYRKDFIGKITGALLDELQTGRGHHWVGLVKVLSQALAERHLLLQFDDSQVTALLAEHGWDNAVRPGVGDFLMVTDTNIGFNKTNAVVDASLAYNVDLTNLSAPVGSLIVTHKNNASQSVPCIHWNTEAVTEDMTYPIDRCYWNYLRIYRPEGGVLLESSPHAVPGEWMLLGQDVPARVDELEEEIPGVTGFGTLLVVPGGQSMNTSFSFTLPPTVIVNNAVVDQRTYWLKVQKQPGTIAIPITIRIHLPNGAVVKSVPAGALVQGNQLLISTDLRTDVEIELVFSLP